MTLLSTHAQGRSQLAVTESATILKRFYFLQRGLVHGMAGWFPGLAHWETKLMLPEVMWEDALLAREFRNRVLELRYPERRVAIDDECELLHLFDRSYAAPNPTAFILGLAEVIKPYVLTLYRDYRGRSDALDDGPSQHLLRHGLADLERQIERLRQVATDALRAFPGEAPSARAWCETLRDIFARLPHEVFYSPTPALESLASTELPLSSAFTISRQGARDPRFQRAAFAWPDRHTPGNPGTGLQLRARQAVHHVNEVWAAEMAAACLHDLGPHAPADFIEEAARWCYDEIRHCRMGYERLREWGFSDQEIPLDSFSYDAGADVDELTRLGIIFYFEATYIHTKRERTVLFADMGDRLSSHDMDFDWADELIHTQYGKRWLEFFLSERKDPRSIAEIKEAARAAVMRRLALATADDKATAEKILERMMAKMV